MCSSPINKRTIILIQLLLLSWQLVLYCFCLLSRQWRHYLIWIFETGSRHDKTRFTPPTPTRQYCKKTEHIQFWNFQSPTVFSRCEFCSLHRRRLDSLVSLSLVVWIRFKMDKLLLKLARAQYNSGASTLQFIPVVYWFGTLQLAVTP